MSYSTIILKKELNVMRNDKTRIIESLIDGQLNTENRTAVLELNRRIDNLEKSIFLLENYEEYKNK